MKHLGMALEQPCPVHNEGLLNFTVYRRKNEGVNMEVLLYYFRASCCSNTTGEEVLSSVSGKACCLTACTFL